MPLLDSGKADSIALKPGDLPYKLYFENLRGQRFLIFREAPVSFDIGVCLYSIRREFFIYRLLLHITICIFLAECASAQKLASDSVISTEEIVVTSSRFPVKLSESPVFTSLISRDVIRKIPGSSLADILKTAPGVYIKSYGGNSSLKTISLNGLGSEHTLILFNGIKLNSSLNSQTDLSIFTKSDISEAEISYNGAGSIFGSDAMGGIINLTGNKNLGYHSFTAERGSSGFQNFIASLSSNIGKSSFSISGKYEKSRNDYEYYFTNGTSEVLKSRQFADYKVTSFSGNIETKFNGYDITLFGLYTDSYRKLPSIETGGTTAFAEQWDENFLAGIQASKIIDTGLKLNASASFKNELLNYINGAENSFYHPFTINFTPGLSFNRERYDIYAGLDFSHQYLTSNNHTDSPNRTQSAAVISAGYRISNVIFYPSIRGEYFSDLNKGIIAGKLGINYKPLQDDRIIFRSSISNNFHAPTFNELYWETGGSLNLKPEKSVNFEAGAEANFMLITKNKVNITYTHIDAKDKILWKPISGSLWSPVNISSSSSSILTVSGEGAYDGKGYSINLSGSYTVNSSVNNDAGYEGKQLYYVPIELAKGSIAVSVFNVSAGLFYSFIGKRYIDFENVRFLPAADIFDASLQADIPVSRLTFTPAMEVKNLFEENYQVISGYPLPLREIYFKLTITYE